MPVRVYSRDMSTQQKPKQPVPEDVFRRALEIYSQPNPLTEYLEEEKRSREACDRALTEKALVFEI